MQICSHGLELQHDAVAIDPDLGISHATHGTYSPSQQLTQLHYHDSLEIGYCYEGSGVFLVDGHVLPFESGCASIIAPRALHIARSSASAPSQWRFLNLDPARLAGTADAPWLGAPLGLGERSILGAHDASGLPRIVRELIEESDNRDAAMAQAVRGLAQCLLARLSRMNPQRLSRDAKAVSAALERIVAGYAQPVDNAQLAAVCGMAPSTFRRAFQRAVGRPPGDYVHALRIQMAALRLRTSSHAVLDIALSVGYESLSAFNRQFKTRLGCSPRDYRKSCAAL